MKSVTMSDADWRLVLEGLDELYEVACEDADEGKAENVTSVRSEISGQAGIS